MARRTHAAARGVAFAAVLSAVITRASTSRADDTVSLTQALALARAANARMPVASLEVAAAGERVRESEAQRWLRLSVQSDIVYTLPGLHYGVSPVDEERLQLAADQPVYHGGALRAQVERDRAQLAAAGARYRLEMRDVEYDVMVQYSTCLQLDALLQTERDALQRLRDYLTWLEDRRAAGQGVQADLLRTRLQVDSSQADLETAEQQLAADILALNDLMGRSPREPLALAPLAAPAAPVAAADAPWRASPDVRAAQASADAARADVEVTKSERRPRIDVSADAGLWGNGLQPNPPGLSISDRLRNDLGVSVKATFVWDFWDAGIYDARLNQARIALRRARASVVVADRQARLQWETAVDAEQRLYRIVQVRQRAVPVARDAYALVEAQYRGGVGTVLDVLTAYRSWIDAANALASAVLDYRKAEALALRWSSP